MLHTHPSPLDHPVMKRKGNTESSSSFKNYSKCLCMKLHHKLHSQWRNFCLHQQEWEISRIPRRIIQQRNRVHWNSLGQTFKQRLLLIKHTVITSSHHITDELLLYTYFAYLVKQSKIFPSIQYVA